MTQSETKPANDSRSEIALAIESTLAELGATAPGTTISSLGVVGNIPDATIEEDRTARYTMPMAALAEGDGQASGSFVSHLVARDAA